MIFKCKMCGGDITPIEGTNTGKCEYCKSLMTLPNLDNEKIVNLYNRANDLRLSNEFDKAYGVYETILELDNNQVEAHWGILLCKYGVEYIDDPKTKLKIPTCHRTIQTSILKDAEYKYIKENAFGDALKLYEDEAKRIDEIQKGILEISSKEEPYDIFICYKETDENGERTHDSVIAQDIYDKLIEKNYKVFFARITLENKLGTQYEPYIYSALNSSKVMLVVGTSDVHLNSVWVKNEWSRYLEMMKFDKTKMIVPVYSKMDAYKLPEEFVMFQAQSMDKIGAIQDLIRGIDKIINNAKEAPKTDVDKIKRAMEEASNLGNGKYEAVVMKEKMSTIFYLLIILMMFGIGLSLFLNLKKDTLISIDRYVMINILDLNNFTYLPAVFSGISYILCIAALMLSIINRKLYKKSKFLMVLALLFEMIKIGIIGKFAFFDCVIIPFLIDILFIFAKPKWHIDSSSKLVVDKNKKNEIQKNNDKLIKNFKEKDEKIIPLKLFLVVFVILIFVGIFVLYSIFIVPQSNAINDDVRQVRIVSDSTGVYLNEELKEKTKIAKVKSGEYFDLIEVIEGNKEETWFENKFYDKYYIKTNHGIVGYISSKDAEIVYEKGHEYHGNIQSNERNLNVFQVKVITDNLKIRHVAGSSGMVIGNVKKDEVYTVLEQKEKSSQIWYKIKTNLGVEGYIADSYEDEIYIEELHTEEEIRVQKIISNAIKAVEGTWHWKNFFGYYMELKDGKISYGSNLDHSVNNSSEFWFENTGSYTYDIDKGIYILQLFYGDTMTYDGNYLRIYDEYGEPATFFDGYASRVK